MVSGVECTFCPGSLRMMERRQNIYKYETMNLLDVSNSLFTTSLINSVSSASLH